MAPSDTTTIILARHGEAEYESPNWADEGGCLTDLGRRQARDLSRRLSGRGITHVWTSTYARAVQTGEIAAAGLGVSVTTRHGLREFGVGDFAGTPRATDPFLPTFATWLDGDLHARAPGGESAHELVERFGAALRGITERHCGETVLVVAHGGIMRIGVPRLAQVDVPPQRIANGAVIEVAADERGWRCTTWDKPHP